MEEKIADVELNEQKENNNLDEKSNNVDIDTNNEKNEISELNDIDTKMETLMKFLNKDI